MKSNLNNIRSITFVNDKINASIAEAQARYNNEYKKKMMKQFNAFKKVYDLIAHEKKLIKMFIDFTNEQNLP